MKLTVQEMAEARAILTFTGEVDVEGKPVRKTYAGAEHSAIRWFFKNTDDVMKAYDEKLTKKREKVDKKYEKQKDEDEKLFRKLRTTAEKAPEDGLKREDVIALKMTMAILGEKSAAATINKELNEDKDLVKAFSEDEHEVDVKDKTLETVKAQIEKHPASADNAVYGSLCDKFSI